MSLQFVDGACLELLASFVVADPHSEQHRWLQRGAEDAIAAQHDPDATSCDTRS